jgi:hypothetical protein
MQTILLPARVRPLSHRDVTDGLVGHEARHAAVASLLGFTVSSIRADWPQPGVAGRVTFDHSAERWDDVRLAEFFITAAAGAMGEKGWPPPWPPSSSAPDSDEGVLARIAGLLNLDERKYLALTAIAHKTVEHPAVQRAQSALSTLLERTTLTGKQASCVAEISFEAHFKELHEAQQLEAQQLEAQEPEALPEPADDETPQEREPLEPHHQKLLERNLANLTAALRHNSHRAAGAKGLGTAARSLART